MMDWRIGHGLTSDWRIGNVLTLDCWIGHGLTLGWRIGSWIGGLVIDWHMDREIGPGLVWDWTY